MRKILLREKAITPVAAFLLLITACSTHVAPTHDEGINPKAHEWTQQSFESVSKGEYGDAIMYATNAINLQPDLINAYINRSWAYCETGMYENAIQDSNKVLALDQNNPMAFNNKGLAYQRMGRATLASAEYKKACEQGLETACVNYKSLVKPTPPPPVLVSVAKKDTLSQMKKNADEPVMNKIIVPEPAAESKEQPQVKRQIAGLKKKIVSDSKGMYPETSTRYLTLNDTKGKSAYELKIMRNEIYARQSYIFKTSAMKEYFSRYSWYTPLHTDVFSKFSKIEKTNIQFIRSHE